jgi:iron complex outermembrane receptor protein
MAGVQSNWGGIRAFWNHFAATADLTSPRPFPQDISTETIDIEGEFARQFHFLVDHNLHLGLGYRRKHVTWNLFPEPRSENHYRVFFQDTLKLADPVILVLGFRVDRHPLLANLQFSPRAALVFRPSEGTAFRISSGRAFRTQTFLESYFGNNSLQTPVPAISATGLGSYYRNLLLGDPRIKPEQIISTEIGFSASQDSFTFDINGYVNRVQNLIIQVQQTVPYTVADSVLQSYAQFSPSASAFPFGVAGFENDSAVFTVVGGEVSARVFPVRGLDLYANYAINKTYLHGNPLRAREARTSVHAVNAGVQYRSLFGLDFGADIHYSSKQFWSEQVASATGLNMTEFALPAYYLVNARVGYRLLNDTLELGVVGYNITHNLHRQHPLAQVIGSRVMGTVGYRF